MPSILFSTSALFLALPSFRPSRIASVSRAARLIGIGGQIGGIDDQQDRIGVFRARPGRADHGAVQPAARPEDARRIDKHDLGFARHRDAAHGHARGLHLGGDDGDLGAHQRIVERGFAGIGRADDGAEAAARGHVSPTRASSFAAASCSASRLEPPSPRLRRHAVDLRLRPRSAAHGRGRRGRSACRPARAAAARGACAHSCSRVLASRMSAPGDRRTSSAQ